MMDGSNIPEIGVWKIVDGIPERFQIGQIEYENFLEEWIEHNPTLIQNNLMIVGRQVRVETGIIDLLGIDTFGCWAVIEIKRGAVRRKTVLQAVDYASCIAELQPEELKHLASNYLASHGTTLKAFLSSNSLDMDVFSFPVVNVYVVGTGRDVHLERMTKNLLFQGNPINVVNFRVFENETGERLIVRSLTETQSTSKGPVTSPPPKDQREELERLFALADENGIGQEFRIIYDAAVKQGLFPRTHKWSIMFTPPQNKTRVIIYARVKPKRGKLHLFVPPSTIAEFFPVSEKEVRRTLTHTDSCDLTLADAERFAKELGQLFRKIEASS